MRRALAGVVAVGVGLFDEDGGGRLRVLYTTGYPDDAIVHHGVLEEEVVEKPLRPRTLLAKVQAVLGVGH